MFRHRSAVVPACFNSSESLFAIRLPGAEADRRLDQPAVTREPEPDCPVTPRGVLLDGASLYSQYSYYPNSGGARQVVLGTPIVSFVVDPNNAWNSSNTGFFGRG